MTRSALLVSSAVALTMAIAGSAADAKNMPQFMAKGKINAQLPLRAPLHSPGIFSTRAKVALRYERGFTSFSASKNVSGFSNPASGVYCITPSAALNYATIEPQVTLEWSLSSGFSFVDFWENGAFDCPNPSTQIEVRTYDTSGNPTELSAFVLQIG
jgi:hypothetical protein